MVSLKKIIHISSKIHYIYYLYKFAHCLIYRFNYVNLLKMFYVKVYYVKFKKSLTIVNILLISKLSVRFLKLRCFKFENLRVEQLFIVIN